VLSPGTEPVLLGQGNGGGTLAVTPCAAEVRRSGTETVACRGQITRWSGDPLAGAATFRHLAIEAADGALLVAIARGEPGAEGHGEERASAWRIGEDGTESAFEEALISTQYSGAGRPTRVGLELWPGEDGPPMRVACSILGSAEMRGGWASFLNARTDGAEGLGSYLLWRA
jgi:hypothetical protein